MVKIFESVKNWLRNFNNSDIKVLKIKILTDINVDELTEIPSEKKIKTSSELLKYIEIIKNNLYFILKCTEWNEFKDDTVIFNHLRKIQISIDEICKYLYSSAVNREINKIAEQLDISKSEIRVNKTVRVDNQTETKTPNS